HTAKWGLPRLKKFASHNCGHPPNLTMDVWKRILQEMIFGLEYVLHEDDMEHEERLKTKDKAMRGLAFIARYYFDLWD
ncbi:MAG TPA: hypothetical protein VMZ91_06225, partial [Candidatus Paceibacterota bacterium]|nr:hypothetical protein [Candidatus Paceibacterota bacterium]